MDVCTDLVQLTSQLHANFESAILSVKLYIKVRRCFYTDQIATNSAIHCEQHELTAQVASILRKELSPAL